MEGLCDAGTEYGMSEGKFALETGRRDDPRRGGKGEPLLVDSARSKELVGVSLYGETINF